MSAFVAVSSGIATFEALGFAVSAALCAMMAVLQWRSSRLAGGARINVIFWVCGLIWTLPNFLRVALYLSGVPHGAPVLLVLEAIGWTSTSTGPLIGASAIGPGAGDRRILIGLAAVASGVLLTLTLAVSFGMSFPLAPNEIALVALAGTILFALASGGLSTLLRALADRSSPARWVAMAGLILAPLEFAASMWAKLTPGQPIAQVVGIALGQQWPIPWAILVAVFLARTHYVDVVVKRSLALMGALALTASLLWPVLGPGLPLVLASLLATGLMLATPALARLLGVAVDRGLLRRPDYARLAAAYADEARRAADEEALLALARQRVTDALRLDARFEPGDAEPGPGVVRKSIIVAGRRTYGLDAEPANPNRALLQAEHAFLGRVAVETSRRLEALALEAERRLQQTREAALKHTATEAELRALRSQVDTHFLFNTLNGIAALVSTDPEKAEAMTEGLADIFRYTLSRQDHGVSTLDEELEFVGKYLAIEQVRFGERLAVEVDRDEGLGGWTVPSLILQPLVENAVRHGLAPKREGGRISISATRVGGQLQLRVADNGVGVARTPGRRQGIGLANVRARLASLYGEASQMSIGAGVDGRGTAVRLLLPAAAGMAHAG